MPDIVYILKNTIDNPELQYSLRSVEKNFSGHRVVFVGGQPRNLSPDARIKVLTNYGKWENARHNILTACKNNMLTKSIYIFNDDFFILKPQDEIPIYSNGELSDFIEMVERNTGKTSFVKRLKQAYRVLLGKGLPTKNYEVHVPMLIDRRKMLKIEKEFPGVPCLRTLYGNYYQMPSIEIDPTGGMMDGVQQVVNGKIDTERVLVSTNDKTFSGVSGEQIKAMFQKPSKYEREIYG